MCRYALFLLAASCAGRPLELPAGESTAGRDGGAASPRDGGAADLSRALPDAAGSPDLGRCQLGFDVKQSGAWPSTQGQVVTGDFDGDGHADFVTFDSGGYPDILAELSTKLVLFAGHGDGSFDLPRLFVVDVDPEGFPWAILAGDFDEDGRTDLALVQGSSPTPVSVQLWRGRADRTLVRSGGITTATGLYAAAATAGDVNGDGHLDLVLGDSPDKVTLLGAGNGSFTAVGTTTGAVVGNTALALADLDGDGRADLIDVDEMIRIFPALGGGGFDPTAAFSGYNLYGFDAVSVQVADLDGDGIPDLFTDSVYFNGETHSAGGIDFFKGMGGGSFAGGAFLEDDQGQSLLSGYSRLVVDLDGDGTPELAGVGVDGANLEVARRTPGGSYRVAQIPLTMGGWLASADFDEDGRGDLVATGPASFQLVLGRAGGALVSPAPVGTSGANGVSLIDVDGDGRLEIVTGDAVDNGLAVRHFAADGTFGPPETPAMVGPSAGFCPGDFDGDGRLDWVSDGDGYSYGPWSRRGWRLTRQTASGLVVSRVDAPPNSTTSSSCLGAADLDGDGKLDLVVGVWGASSRVEWLRGDGAGGFAPAADSKLALETVPIVADVDGDGHPDLAWLNPTLKVARGHGDGTFDAPLTYAAGSAQGRLAVADLNGDGRPDLIVGDPAQQALQVLLDGPGGAATSWPLAAPLRGLAVGDLDGDGQLDLAASVDTGVLWLRGHGDGGFGTAVEINLPAGSAGPIAVGDIDGDGRRDLVVVGRNSNVASVLRNVCK